MPNRYTLLTDYGLSDGQITTSPSWGIGIIPLARPVTYSRKNKKSMGEVVKGVGLRADPFFIKDECLTLAVSNTLKSSTKNLSATLKGENNFISAILPGDWVMAWCSSDIQSIEDIETKFDKKEKVNYFNSGLKFIGRAHSIRKNISRHSDGKLVSSYHLQATGFRELDSVFYYNPQLATYGVLKDVWESFSQIGLNWFKWTGETHKKAGELRDNSEDLISAFIDIVVGEGVPVSANDPTNNWGKHVGGSVEGGVFSSDARQADISPHSNESPYSYLVPSVVGKFLGVSVIDPNKGSRRGHTALGYADILTLITGVQRYDDSVGFIPDLEGRVSEEQDKKDENKRATRLRCKERLKGTYVPTTELTLLSQPLWSYLSTFVNPAINQIYTALKPNLSGEIVPTVVARQIPFSTDVIKEWSSFPLSRMSAMPKWVISPLMVQSLDVGRSDQSRFNYVQVFASLKDYPSDNMDSETDQIAAGNIPIADSVDIARSGFRPYMNTIQCSPYDLNGRPEKLAPWIEAVADWTIDSQLTFNGTLVCTGIRSPIAEGDFIEFEGLSYHIEGIEHSCSIDGNGYKHFSTTLALTMGMPIDQGKNQQIPRYPGFAKDTNIMTTANAKQLDRLSEVLGVNVGAISDAYSTETQEDDTALTSIDPGRTIE